MEMAWWLVVKAMVVVALAVMPWRSLAGVDISNIRQMVAKYNVTCILVFRDSSVDPGNNNVLPTFMKSNFPPYGKDFFNGLPTGRFSNGRLASDFIGNILRPLLFWSFLQDFKITRFSLYFQYIYILKKNPLLQITRCTIF